MTEKERDLWKRLMASEEAMRDYEIRLYGALWKLVVDGVISEGRAKELSGLNGEEHRKVLVRLVCNGFGEHD